eukprot:10495387-Lingulodinium_polyedra.AAC.1
MGGVWWQPLVDGAEADVQVLALRMAAILEDDGHMVEGTVGLPIMFVYHHKSEQVRWRSMAMLRQVGMWVEVAWESSP